VNEGYIKERYTYEDVCQIVHLLRQPEGCPWDSAQTYESMKTCVSEEAGEVVAAIDAKDPINLKEELGDLMLQVLMYAEIAAEKNDFTLEDVVDELGKKLVRRHPAIFTQPALNEQIEQLQQQENTAENALSLWKAVKKIEKREKLAAYEMAYKAGKISKELLESKKNSL